MLALSANGSAHLIPVAIMVDGQFYDASAYKASPVPMALWPGVVYEAEKSGASQGLFTVGDALQNKQTSIWLAEGKWQTTAALAAAEKNSAARPSKPRGLDDDSGPPVLRHAGSSKPEAPQTGAGQAAAPPASAPAAAPQTGASGSTTQTASSSSAAAPPAAGAPAVADTTQTSSEPEDPNRPVLKRGKQPPKPAQAESAASASTPPGKAAPVSGKASAPGSASSPSSASPQSSQLQIIPAISDADGPEPRSYVFPLKAGEAEEFQKKVLTLAAGEVRTHEKREVGATGAPEHPVQRGKAVTVKVPQPSFKDVQLRVFDLTNSNDATLVLMAKAESVPRASSSGTATSREYFVTVVARQDLNGDLHKVFASVTDAQHFDGPRWELIDAVDANGDGAGELLFRKTSDAGSAFAIYRVIGDQLYPLFEGTPGE